MQHTRTIRLDWETLDRIAPIVGEDQLRSAIGYLSTWGLSKVFVHLQPIYHVTQPEIVACYYDTATMEGRPDFVIVGVWQGDKWGFHS